MTKIFISHASADRELVNPLMDLLQTQFDLRRENFFNTSDQQLRVGGNWVEQIRNGMQEADLIMPIFTPSYFQSVFCLCELGAAWVNEENLVPLIVPPLTYRALDDTPYRAITQTISLGNEEGLSQLWDAFIDRGIGQKPNMTRFMSRTKTFQTTVLAPFITEMGSREVVTAGLVKELRADLDSTKGAYEEVENELDILRAENVRLRQMKDAQDVQVMDDEKMDEWETFMRAVEDVHDSIGSLSKTMQSALYNTFKGSPYITSDQFVKSELGKLESEGLMKWEDGWFADHEHPTVEQAINSLDKLSTVMKDSKEILEERFKREYPGTRFGLQFSPFWVNLFEATIFASD
ncbi:toll/interleukin-1 receptor domain-containing protein [Paenibacillus cucumis (ex Kampfer et al. 2016)]|uniref:Toll/interleukin-1 receptor domain-containing protein n=1 Tax=Paenibacillus cucumis (ex Kampfer et al. 2016) TaxID=1776858 RepID=A0ABS7KST5_9BACL|nr:toll/interleukin-1 receptor domain-containing protein [Paenibacillus cucumis (ex Kampfer et al. 2016)]MBY0207076.1 toll/interleukin-1 receptor domain-containing protein [Paenibacillus cucumis (ex Kampfer et al. 2016)]